MRPRGSSPVKKKSNKLALANHRVHRRGVTCVEINQCPPQQTVASMAWRFLHCQRQARQANGRGVSRRGMTRAFRKLRPRRTLTAPTMRFSGRFNAHRRREDDRVRRPEAERRRRLAKSPSTTTPSSLPRCALRAGRVCHPPRRRGRARAQLSWRYIYSSRYGCRSDDCAMNKVSGGIVGRRAQSLEPRIAKMPTGAIASSRRPGPKSRTPPAGAHRVSWGAASPRGRDRRN